jgi:hypothetical protein
MAGVQTALLARRAKTVADFSPLPCMPRALAYRRLKPAFPTREFAASRSAFDESNCNNRLRIRHVLGGRWPENANGTRCVPLKCEWRSTLSQAPTRTTIPPQLDVASHGRACLDGPVLQQHVARMWWCWRITIESPETQPDRSEVAGFTVPRGSWPHHRP